MFPPTIGILLHPPPGADLLALDLYRARVEPALVALTAEGGDGLGVGQEHLGAAAAAEQLVHVVRGGRAGLGLDPLVVLGVLQQAELGVVDELVLLALAQCLDGQPELVLGLVHRLVVEVGDPGVDLEDGLRDAQLVLARLELVVHEGTGQLVLALVAGGEVDRRLAVLVLRLLEAVQVLHDLQLQRLGAVVQLLEGRPGEHHHGACGGGTNGVRPAAVLHLERLVAQVVAVGQGADHRLLAVLAGAEPLELAVRDQEDLADRRAGGDQDVARVELPLDEAAGQLLQHRLVLVTAQHRHLGQRLRDDPHLGTRLDETHPAAADLVAQAAVDPVGAAGDLHPGQRPEQPARADALHLGRGLGGRGEAPRARRAQGLLLPDVRLRARRRNTGIGFGRHGENPSHAR